MRVGAGPADAIASESAAALQPCRRRAMQSTRGHEKGGRNPSVAIATSAGRCDSTHCDSRASGHALVSRFRLITLTCAAPSPWRQRAHTHTHAWGGAAAPARDRQAHRPLERARAPRRPALHYACDARPCAGLQVGFSRTASVGLSCDAAASSSGRRPALSGASSSGCASLRAAHIASTHTCSPSSAAMCAAVVPVLQQPNPQSVENERCTAQRFVAAQRTALLQPSRAVRFGLRSSRRRFRGSSAADGVCRRQ